MVYLHGRAEEEATAKRPAGKRDVQDTVQARGRAWMHDSRSDLLSSARWQRRRGATSISTSIGGLFRRLLDCTISNREANVSLMMRVVPVPELHNAVLLPSTRAYKIDFLDHNTEFQHFPLMPVDNRYTIQRHMEGHNETRGLVGEGNNNCL
ncbi:hypothetical protein E4T39_00550 [Aureobasidium subglaciale]|nr:hypothetical protein E4T39_00550 [Aureobasidium subglaciale]